MSYLSMGLCGKLARRVVWYTFAPLDKVICSLNNRGQMYYIHYTNIQLPQFLSISHAAKAKWWLGHAVIKAITYSCQCDKIKKLP